MIQTEIIKDKFIHSYSDKKLQILQVETGILYEEAFDLLPLRYSYLETDIPIPPLEEESEIDDSIN